MAVVVIFIPSVVWGLKGGSGFVQIQSLSEWRQNVTIGGGASVAFGNPEGLSRI